MKRIGILIAALFLLTGLSVQAETVNRIAAVVNDQIITAHQLDIAVAGRMADAARGEHLSAEEVEALRAEILSGIIDDVLIGQKMKELGITVSDEEVEAAVLDIQNQNKLTREQLEAALRSQGMDFGEYLENLRRQIRRFKLVNREVKGKVEVTNQELRDYFREHIDAYREKPSVRLARISFSLPAMATSGQIGAVRARAEEARDRLLQGEDLYAVLLEHAAEQGVDGGEMGAFEQGELTAAFADAVQGLQEGEISPLIETPEGFHILQVTGRSPGRVRQFDAVRDEIRETLREEKTEERFRRWSEGLREEAYIDIRL